MRPRVLRFIGLRKAASGRTGTGGKLRKSRKEGKDRNLRFAIYPPSSKALRRAGRFTSGGRHEVHRFALATEEHSAADAATKEGGGWRIEDGKPQGRLRDYQAKWRMADGKSKTEG